MFRHLLSILLFWGLISTPTFGQSPSEPEIEIVTQERIQGTITQLAYSPDGQLIASGSEGENSIKIWDVTSGKIIGKLEGHRNQTTALIFSEDGKKLMSAAPDNCVMYWDLIKWKLIDSLTMTESALTICAGPEKSGTFLTGHKDGSIFKWAPENFHQPTLIYAHDHAIDKLDCYQQIMASGDAAGNLKIFDLQTNEILIEKSIYSGRIMGINFYHKGTGLLTAGQNGKIHLWNRNDLSESKHFDASNLALTAYDANVAKERFVIAAQNCDVKVYDLSGALLYAFKSKTGETEDSEPVKALKISPDGSAMASSGFQRSPVRKAKEDKNVIRIWDLKRGSLYKTLEGSVNPIYSFDFHPSKNELITLGDNNILTFWDFNLAEKQGQFTLEEPKREIPPIRQLNKGPLDRANLAKGRRIGNIVKDVANGNFGGIKDETQELGKTVGINYAKRMFKERSIVKYSEQGTYLITKQKNDEIRLYEFENEKPVYRQSLFSYQASINQLKTSPDEKYLAVLGAGDSAVSIINLETKTFERKLFTAAPEANFRFIYEANSLAFSPDGSLLSVCFNTGKTFVFSTSSWQLVFENILPDNLGYVESPFVNFSEDGQYMVVKSMLGLKKYNTSNFDIFGSEPLKINGYSVPMDKPQDYAITIFEDYIYFENLFTNEVKRSIHVSPKQITHISIHPKGLVGITLSSGQFHLLDPKTGNEEILLVGQGDNYIFKTAENYYKVSKEGYDLVTFRIGNQAFPFEQFDAVFNRPDLVLSKLNCTDEELISLYEKAYLKRVTKLGLRPTNSISLADIPKTSLLNVGEIPAITEQNSIDLSIKLTDRTKLSNYNIWVNNVPVHGKNGKVTSGTSQQIKETVSLIHGLNKIQIACRNANGYESLIQTFYVEKTGPAPKRDLYLITIGTANYKDTRYNLSYPVKDGQDLEQLMQSNTSGLYENIKTKSLYNETVTKENIAGLSSFLSTSQANDVVIVFVAGHGILDANFDYYFGTYDINFSQPNLRGLAYEKLEELLDGIKANRKILIMDTCHSGEVDKDDVFFASNEEEPEDEDVFFRAVGDAVKSDDTKATPSRLATELFNDLRKGTGATVISSAGGLEFAMESAEWKNGLFTYCMLNGLKNRTSDLNEDGKIMLLELQAYVVGKVTALSHGRQVPNSRIKNIELDFPVW